jgi:hypothetical protein
VTDVEPNWLDEVISVIPAMRENCLSSGVATAEAIVSGLAPGNPAFTEIVGNSTSGKGETGSSKYAIAPAINTATESSVVATGLRMNVAEMCIALVRRSLSRDRIPNLEA